MICNFKNKSCLKKIEPQKSQKEATIFHFSKVQKNIALSSAFLVFKNLISELSFVTFVVNALVLDLL